MIEKTLMAIVIEIQKNARSYTTGLGILSLGLMMSYWHTQHESSRHLKAGDQYFSLVSSQSERDPESIKQFVKEHKDSIYSDLLLFETAQQHFNDKDNEKAEEILSGIANRSRMKSLRSLALYRLANMIKEEKPEQALKYSEKIETKSMNGAKAILKAQIYENMGKKSNALIELNSLLSSNSARTELDQDNLLLLEIANHHRQRLQQSK